MRLRIAQLITLRNNIDFLHYKLFKMDDCQFPPALVTCITLIPYPTNKNEAKFASGLLPIYATYWLLTNTPLAILVVSTAILGYMLLIKYSKHDSSVSPIVFMDFKLLFNAFPFERIKRIRSC